MAIQVDNSLHAAATLIATENPEGPDEPPILAQSPQGCLLQKIETEELPAFLILLDYPLDYASTSFEAVAFASADPFIGVTVPFSPLLVHIDDRTKLLVMLADLGEGLQPVISSFHLALLNYQANLSQMLPVEQVPPPV